MEASSTSSPPAHSPSASAPVKAPKSPPLAFQMTSNDTLIAPVDQHNSSTRMTSYSPDGVYSPGTREKLDYGPSRSTHEEMQAQIRRQAEALHLQHAAFAVERDCWDMERDRLYRRITALESLLKTANGHRYATLS